MASDQCRCCELNVVETMEHILQCPTRDPTHSTFFSKFLELMRDKEILNDIVRLFEAGINIAVLTPLRCSYDDTYTDDDDIMTDARVTKILTDETIREDRQEAFKQQTRMGWTKIFMGFFTSSWRTST